MNAKDTIPTLLSLPSPFVLELVTKLLPFSVKKNYPPRRTLTLSSENAHFCYLISKGSFVLHRQNDDRIVGFGNAPVILGLGNLTQMYIGSYIRTITTCEIGIIPTHQLFEIIERENLWRPLAEHLLIIGGKLFTIGQQLSAPTTYEIIRAQLLELISENETIKNSTTVENYIRLKTNLSRSMIMKILASLKAGGYIELERGKLIKINSLPKKY
ncbi:helix-turn-helix domain-containing protein [Buttiauxella selenatireducens]|uniref:Helix-turn-helix domain-containing protein n=1 Tax=Buttiauxella selenatireducens TaxID=3073902 RepID=A0ABY9SDU3_9ENTR|nr:helix-turn-helix domain-containing protein [Buttiauxella sp. R73]WMY75326.1 helix-turn-helix domain-containing protein [Buttiauxella sp. R73]